MILTPNEIIKKSLNEYKLGISKGKREEVIKHLNYYSGFESDKHNRQ